MKLSDFDYHLPEELIAQHPPESRAGGRLLDVAALMAGEATAGLRVDGAHHPADAALQAQPVSDGGVAARADELARGRSGALAGGAPAADDALAASPDRMLTDLPALLAPGSLLVFNDTRVINARLMGRKESGGRVEVMVERLDDEFEVLAMIRASHAPREGSRLFFGTAMIPDPVESKASRSESESHADTPLASATVVSARQAGGMMLRLRFDKPAAGVLERLGQLPLPPYIQHVPDADDRERYQTVFAREPGAVAAPTAGLHFDEALLAALDARGIARTTLTLHVGAGTFLPVRTENLAEHRMHAERYHLSADSADAIARAKAEGRPVVAVGTTALRALEASGGKAGSGETELFITPGYGFRVVDRLFTNFHLPRSTLLILVSAFAGRDTIRRAYEHAIMQRYRFFSYGDAMLLDRAT